MTHGATVTATAPLVLLRAWRAAPTGHRSVRYSRYVVIDSRQSPEHNAAPVAILYVSLGSGVASCANIELPVNNNMPIKKPIFATIYFLTVRK